ncbi:MAG: hypothetical protein EXR79_15240 [Myxococcales bacterium]|nr:hypothetical protein [Myxococcales bacterium]
MSRRTRYQRELLEWMRAWQSGAPWATDTDVTHFEDLALRLFALQYETIPAYQALCNARGLVPGNVRESADIPLVPVSAFKSHRVHTDAAERWPAYTFHTSGTSDGRPGIVRLADTALYDGSLQAAFQHFVVPEAQPDRAPVRFRCISLVPTAAARPHSSLGYMVRRLAQRWDDGLGSQHIGNDEPEGRWGTSGAWRNAAEARQAMTSPDAGAGSADIGALDLSGLHAALERAVRHEVPVLLLTTSVALARWFEVAPAQWQIELPAGSRVMDTGGAKGRHVEIDRAAQHAELVRRLGVPASHVIGEFGMTELASQRYETTLRSAHAGDVEGARAFAGPPWLQTRVLRPADRSGAGPGDTGMLAHIDLANLDHGAFVLTADLGRAVDMAGGGGIELSGRVPGAEWRGCGLDVEDLPVDPA